MDGAADGLVFAALSAVLAVLFWLGRAGGSATIGGVAGLRARSAIPPLLIAFLFVHGCDQQQYDALRLRLTDIEAHRTIMAGSASAQTAIVVGSQAAEADLVVPGARGTFLAAALSLGTMDEKADAKAGRSSVPGIEAVVDLRTIAAEGDATITSYRRDGGPATFVGSVDLVDGDELCLRDCANAANRFRFHGSGQISPAGENARPRSLPTRSQMVGRVRPWGPNERVYRLAEYLCVPGEPTGCPASASSAAGGAALSFIYQTGGWFGTGWQVILLDPGAELRRKGAVIATGSQSIADPEKLAPGQAIHVAFHSLQERRLAERRSISLEYLKVAGPATTGSLRLSLDTPELAMIGGIEAPITKLLPSGASDTTDAVTFSALGTRPESGIPATLQTFALPAHAKSRASVEIEARSDPVTLRFRLDRIGFPWILLIVAATCALVFHVAGEARWLANPLEGQIYHVAQYLLALRALVAISGASLDSALSAAALQAEAALAMVSIPLLVITCSTKPPHRRATLIGLAIFAVAAMLATWRALALPDRESLALLAAAIAVTAWRLLRPAPARQARAIVPPPMRPWFWLWLVGVMALLRGFLYLLDFKERIFGFPFSVIYLPVLLAAVASLLADAERSAPEARLGWGWRFLLVLAIALGPMVTIVRDTGFALVFLPPIAAFAVWRSTLWRQRLAKSARSLRTKAARLAWSAPALALVAAYALLWMTVGAWSPPTQAASPERQARTSASAMTPAEDPVAAIERQVAFAADPDNSNMNYLRLRAMAAPAQLQWIGNRASVQQLEQTLMLRELTDDPFGDGYLRPLNLNSFSRYHIHLSDVVSAVHLMAPFGRIGALCFLLALAAAAGAACCGRVGMPASAATMRGALAIWTLFAASAYMVVCNLMLVPFTGRNVYLLASSSGGDLFEGALLLLMARLGLDQGSRR